MPRERGRQWIFVWPCDCPYGVMEGHLADDDVEAMQEMFEGSPDGELKARREGLTARLISFETYTSTYYPKMTVSCTHRVGSR